MTTVDICIVAFTIAMSVFVVTINPDGPSCKTMERFAMSALWVMMAFVVALMMYLVYIF